VNKLQIFTNTHLRTEKGKQMKKHGEGEIKEIERACGKFAAGDKELAGPEEVGHKRCSVTRLSG
jgi:hypothetical protein